VLLVALPPKEKGAMWTIEDVEVVNMKFHSYVLTFAQDEDNELYVLTSDNTAPTRVSTRFTRSCRRTERLRGAIDVMRWG